MSMRNVFTGILLTASIATFFPASAQQPPAAASAAPSRREVRMGTKPQEFLMAKVVVSDLVKSYEFYTQVIGLKLVTSPDIPTAKAPTPTDPEKDFVEIPLNYSGSMADALFLLIKRRGQKPSPEWTSMVTLGFKVPDSRVVVERAVNAGYKAPRGVPGEGQAGFVSDPDGYNVELVSTPSFTNP